MKKQLTLLLALLGMGLLAQSTDSLSISPNPFSIATTLHFELKQSNKVTLQLINLWGVIVKTFYNDTLLQQGSYHLTLLGDSLKNGLYIIRFDTGSENILAYKILKDDLATNIPDVKSQRKEISLFPNPTRDVLSIPVQGIKAVIIKDQSGRLVKSVTTTEGRISVSDLKPGTYLVSVQIDNKELISAQKVIIVD
jgi:hypothetical protein